MAFVPAPNIVQVEIIGLKDGQIIENRFHVNVLGEPTSGNLATLNGAVQAWINTHYLPRLPDEVAITEVRLTSLHQQNGIQLSSPMNVTGAGTTGAMPNEVTLCVSLRTGFVGRSARGRFYLLGLPLDVMDTQNRVLAAYRSAVATALQALISGINAAGFVMVIVSYITNNAPRVGGPVYFVVSSAVVTDDIVDSQRRRRPGVGQ